MKKFIKTVLQLFERLQFNILQCGFKIRMKRHGISYGKDVITYNALPTINVSKRSKCVFGDGVVFQNFSNTSWASKNYIYVHEGASLTIGKNTGLNGSFINCKESIFIGENVKIGGTCKIYDNNFHSTDFVKRRDPNQDRQDVVSSPIVIGNDAFIGMGCIIGKGVTIGERTIIAAGSVVVKSIPADCIAGGNPCKVIKQFNG